MIKAEVIKNGTADKIEVSGTLPDITQELVFLTMVIGRQIYEQGGELFVDAFRNIFTDYVNDDGLWSTIRVSVDDVDEIVMQEGDC